jgi:hypothetical protein
MRREEDLPGIGVLLSVGLGELLRDFVDPLLRRDVIVARERVSAISCA